MAKAINGTGVAPAIGPYSAAIATGDLLFCSGQLGMDPATGDLRDGVAAQAEQALVNLRAAKRLAEARESAAIDAMLEEHRPFDDTSPISRDYADFMRGIIAKEHAAIDRLEHELHAEEQWRGGHEEGAENDDHLAAYDHMEEF